jgi:outer membrane receptor protein involved in Fe transport
VPSNPNRAKVQALCEALIGNMTSEFNTQTFNTPHGPDGWTRQIPTFFPLEIAVQTGNPAVKPETGRTFTLGTVLREPFGVSNLTATLDFYRIKMTDTISPESVVTVYNDCFNSDGASNPTYDVHNPACQLISRNPITGDRAAVASLYENLGTLLTQGLDVNVGWSHQAGPGLVGITVAANYLDTFKYQTDPKSALVNARGTLDPVNAAAGQGGLFDYRTLTHLTYTLNGVMVGLSWDHKPGIKDASASTNPQTKVLGVPEYDLFALSSSYSFDRYVVRFGIDNLLDKRPPVVGANPGVTTSSNVTNAGYYDPLGRRFYVGVKATL